MSRQPVARLDTSIALALGHTVARVVLSQDVQDAWRGAAYDSSAAIDAVATAAGSMTTAAGSISRATRVTAAIWRAHGGSR